MVAQQKCGGPQSLKSGAPSLKKGPILFCFNVSHQKYQHMAVQDSKQINGLRLYKKMVSNSVNILNQIHKLLVSSGKMYLHLLIPSKEGKAKCVVST